MDKSLIIEQTKKLIEYNHRADKIFDGVKADGTERDFFLEVKPFADDVHQLAREWAEAVKGWMKAESFSYLYPLQVEQAAENISNVAIQAFYPKTSLSRFKSHVQSVEFTLQNILREAERKLQ
ncbi:YppE family protein [Bacillus sp. M6-12]|uniref:YppE family protein n=1 Tax=Bacillus sp. M6-12 TaxID=2054166 RepID=UPI0015E14C69|nr:YppE family protein [Bacillus sp. M6-12]